MVRPAVAFASGAVALGEFAVGLAFGAPTTTAGPTSDFTGRFGTIVLGAITVETPCGLAAPAAPLATACLTDGCGAIEMTIGRSCFALATSTVDCAGYSSDTEKDPWKATSAAVMKNAHATAPISETATPKPETTDFALRIASRRPTSRNAGSRGLGRGTLEHLLSSIGIPPLRL